MSPDLKCRMPDSWVWLKLPWWHWRGLPPVTSAPPGAGCPLWVKPSVSQRSCVHISDGKETHHCWCFVRVTACPLESGCLGVSSGFTPYQLPGVASRPHKLVNVHWSLRLNSVSLILGLSLDSRGWGQALSEQPLASSPIKRLYLPCKGSLQWVGGGSGGGRQEAGGWKRRLSGWLDFQLPRIPHPISPVPREPLLARPLMPPPPVRDGTGANSWPLESALPHTAHLTTGTLSRLIGLQRELGSNCLTPQAPGPLVLTFLWHPGNSWGQNISTITERRIEKSVERTAKERWLLPRQGRLNEPGGHRWPLSLKLNAGTGCF